MKTYCVSCKSKSESIDGKEVETSNKKRLYKAKCGLCSHIKTTFLKAKQTGGRIPDPGEDQNNTETETESIIDLLDDFFPMIALDRDPLDVADWNAMFERLRSGAQNTTDRHGVHRSRRATAVHLHVVRTGALP